MSGKYVIIEADGSQRSLKEPKKSWPLETMQGLVGTQIDPATVERIRVRYEGKVRDAFVDENGWMKRLPFNPSVTRMLAPPYDGQDIVGRVVIWVPDYRPHRKPKPDVFTDETFGQPHHGHDSE